MPDLSSLDPRPRPPAAASKLADFLYPSPARRTVGGIFKWWEKRRLAYNAVVGVCGSMSTAAIAAVVAALEGGFSVAEALAPGLAVLVMANFCYTLGPIVETALQKLWGDDVRPVGPHLWRAGLTFSVGLTFVLPMAVLFVRLVVGLVQGF